MSVKITQQLHFPNITLVMPVTLFLEDKKSLNLEKRKKGKLAGKSIPEEERLWVGHAFQEREEALRVS